MTKNQSLKIKEMTKKIKELEETIKKLREIGRKGSILDKKLRNLTREAILERDNFKCRLCGEKEGLQLHHLTPRELGGENKPYNLLTVCMSCHLFLHCNPKMVIQSKQGQIKAIKEGLEKRKLKGLPVGRQKGAKDKKKRQVFGYNERYRGISEYKNNYPLQKELNWKYKPSNQIRSSI